MFHRLPLYKTAAIHHYLPLTTASTSTTAIQPQDNVVDNPFPPPGTAAPDWAANPTTYPAVPPGWTHQGVPGLATAPPACPHPGNPLSPYIPTLPGSHNPPSYLPYPGTLTQPGYLNPLVTRPGYSTPAGYPAASGYYPPPGFLPTWAHIPPYPPPILGPNTMNPGHPPQLVTGVPATPPPAPAQPPTPPHPAIA